jgi:hypothetical protein
LAALFLVLVLGFRHTGFLFLLFSFRILGNDATNGDGRLLEDFIFNGMSWFEAYLLYHALLGLEILVHLLVRHNDNMADIAMTIWLILLVGGSF